MKLDLVREQRGVPIQVDTIENRIDALPANFNGSFGGTIKPRARENQVTLLTTLVALKLHPPKRSLELFVLDASIPRVENSEPSFVAIFGDI